MNPQFSSSKTLRGKEGCKILEEEAISFFGESSMKDAEEYEEEEDLGTAGLWERLGFAELEEAEDMLSIKEVNLRRIRNW